MTRAELRTTTWPGRNLPILDAAASALPAGTVAVLQVGPGMAVRGLGRLGRPGTPLGRILGRVEMLVRRLPLPDGWFETYETGELLAALGLDPAALTVADISRRALRVVALNHPGIATAELDLSEPLPESYSLRGRFDLVVAFNMVGRAGNKETAIANLAALARPGGLVAENSADLTHRGLVRLGEGLYRRP